MIINEWQRKAQILVIVVYLEMTDKQPFILSVHHKYTTLLYCSYTSIYYVYLKSLISLLDMLICGETCHTLGTIEEILHSDLCFWSSLNRFRLMMRVYQLTPCLWGCLSSLNLKRVLWTQHLMSNHRLFHLPLLALRAAYLIELLLSWSCDSHSLKGWAFAVQELRIARCLW